MSAGQQVLAASGSSATTGAATISAVTSTTGYIPAFSAMTIRTGAGGQIALTASATYSPSALAAYAWYGLAKWQFRVPAGTWNDVSGEVGGTNAVTDSEGNPIEDGSIAVNATLNNLSALTDYEVRLMVRESGGTGGRVLSWSGTASATGS